MSALKSTATMNRTLHTNQLVTVLSQLRPIPPEVANFFHDRSTLVKFKRGEVILNAGDFCNYYYFICAGVVRGFVQNSGTDITTWISVKNEIVTSIYSLHNRQPALETIQALEDCTLLCLKVEDLEELYTDIPYFNEVGRKLLEMYYRDAELRAYMARIPDAEMKYRFFLSQYPHLADTVAMKFIAAYLGIRQETLSRIKKRIQTGS